MKKKTSTVWRATEALDAVGKQSSGRELAGKGFAGGVLARSSSRDGGEEAGRGHGPEERGERIEPEKLFHL